MRITDFAPNQSKTLAVTVPGNAIERFAELSGDVSAVHVDAAFARRAGFAGPLVHGAYLAALVSRFVGMELPGPHAILERMDVSFRKPCYAPVDLVLVGTVKQVSQAVSTVIVETTIARTDGEVLASARTWHKVLD